MRARWSAWWLVPSMTLAVVAAVLAATGRWRLVAVLPLGTYVDLAQVTHNASCAASQAGRVGSTACDLFGRPYNYPPIWAQTFRLLHLGAGSTAWLGTALVAVGLAALAVFYAHFAGRPTRGRVLTLTALTCSPPMLLLVARANTDLVPLVLLVAAALLISFGRAAWAAPLVALASGIKLWPIGAVAAFRGRRALGLTAALSVAAVVVIAGPHLLGIRRATPSTVHTTFGIGVLPAVVRHHGWGQIHGRDQLAGLAIFMATAVALVVVPLTRRALHSAAAALQGNSVAATAHLVGAGPALSTYVLSSSFDYRLAPLLFVAAACVAVGGPETRALLVLIFIAFWACVTRSPAQLVGDAALLLAMPALALIAVTLLWSQHPSPAARRVPGWSPVPRTHRGHLPSRADR